MKPSILALSLASLFVAASASADIPPFPRLHLAPPAVVPAPARSFPPATAPRYQVIRVPPTPEPKAEPATFAAAQRRHWGTSGTDLAAGTIVGVAENPTRGKMASQIVTVRTARGGDVRVLFKPARGEKDILLWEKGTFYRSEIAASRLSDLLGLDLVPPTVPMTVQGEKGSAQLYVENAPAAASAYPERNWVDRHKRQVMAVFDYVIGNTDRHEANWLLRDKGTEPIAIDHGLAFPSFKVRSLSFYLPPAIDPETRALFARVPPQKIAETLADSGISDIAIRETLERLADVLATVGPTPLRSPATVAAIAAAARHR